MKIVIVSQQGNKAAGAEHALLQFVERLPSDVQLHWIFFEDGEFAQAIRERFGSMEVITMSTHVAGAKRDMLPVRAVLDSAALIVRLARRIASLRPDLVLTNSMKAHVIGSVSAKLAGRRAINYIHDIVDGPAIWLLRAASGLCASERLVCSGKVRQALKLPRTSVLHAAIDATLFAALPEQQGARRQLGLPLRDVPVIGLVGRIARWKGQDRFLRIATMVLARCDAHFCIVGSPIFGCDAGYMDELRGDVARLGLTDRVTFVPWQADMRVVYAAIDIACNCSFREPFGRTSLEALAAGRPVVCFDDAGVCEVFDQAAGGTHVPAGNERAFADAVTAYVTDTDRYRAASRSAETSARKTDIARTYGAFAQTLERVGRATIGTAAAPGSLDAGVPVVGQKGSDVCVVR